ncbi:hypothetical protein EHS39_32915 [Ensifer sp. MPMI2T]|nr:hypothetical protein EHS39_32915 [Ensifer sp. MPMI2T]
MEAGREIDAAAVGTAFEELERARCAYEDADAAEGAARLRATEALNKLNNAQKRFDSVIGKVRDQHPVKSDWRFRARSGESA